MSFPRSAAVLLAAAACAAPAPRATPAPQAHATSAAPLPESLFRLVLDRDAGAVRFVLPAPGADGVAGEFLYVSSLARGLGANDVGLDRGQLGEARVVRFRVVGPRVLLEQRNLAFRADDADADAARATEESFAGSVLWAGEVTRRAAGELEFDATSLVVRDMHGAARALERSGQGTFRLDDERSVALLDACVALPDNVELEALLTLECDEPGPSVRATAPDARAVTLRQHHSFLRLPDDGYRPRRWDPRSGAFAVAHVDTTAGIAEPAERRLATRFRLQRGPDGRTLEPLVYHVDRGAPEPIRTALLEGASWWRRAFAAAGFPDGFRVELLPEGVHPLDVRYNVIQWVHRSTRGWSYGGGIVDPRTGEQVVGRVTLGALRVRQDRLLFEGLLGTDALGSGDPARDPVELSLARIRQLAAHEVGHTLGLAHNFAASTCGRASVMDYPAPLVRLDASGELDASDAYAVGVGAWDELAIRWLYGEYGTGEDEARALDTLVSEGVGRGLRFHSDEDARPAGGAHPAAALWDNGDDPAAELQRVLAVRAAALARFDEGALAAGRPLAELEEVFAPLWFHHRYQVEATAKVVGGVEWRHALRGEDAPPLTPVDAAEQARALEALLDAVAPEALLVPERVRGLLLPRPPEMSRGRELLRGDTQPAFDFVGAAESAAALVFDALLVPERCARLHDQPLRDPRLPSLADVLETIELRCFAPSVPPDPERAEPARAVERAVVARWLALARSAAVAARVRAVFEERLEGLGARLAARADAHSTFLARTIERVLEGDVEEPALEAPELPPGSPIGCGAELAAR